MNVKNEDFANSLTHGLGVVIFLIAALFIFLDPLLLKVNPFWPLVVYSLCLLTTYTISTVYHAVTSTGKKALMRKFDHISIFLLIGGTFTPIVVYNMGDWNGLPFLASFWGVLVGGMVFKIFFTGKFKLVSTIIYIGVAWVGAFFAWPLVHSMPRLVVSFVIVGGLFYTIGTLFYMRKNMPYHHAIWHLFVLAGSAAHFYAILLSLQA
jgi:hemolysin III